MVAPANEVLRVVRALARHADARLAHSAARNAAASVRDQKARRLDDARLLHDLSTAAEGDPVRRRASRRGGR